MLKRLRDESGVAMVTAVLVLFIVTGLSLVSFQLAAHDLDQSANDRRMVQSIHAAEAGIDRFLDYLSHNAPITNPATTMGPENLTTSPPATFSVTATYYCANGSPFSPGVCVSPSGISHPSSVSIQSVGTSAGRTRTMSAFVGLGSVPGGYTLSGAAVFANGVATWTGQAQVTNAVGTELAANLYSNSNLELKGGGAVYGQVEAQGTITLSGTTDVKNFATSKGALSISNNSIVRGDARSTTSSVTNGGVVSGNAYYCTGSAPGGTVTGSRIQACPNPPGPPTQTFTPFVYTESDWTARGYVVQPFASCAAAQTWLNAVPLGNYVVRITPTCSLTIPNVTLRGNLAIISNGDIAGTGATSFSVSGTPNPNYVLNLMANVTSSTASCGANSGVTLAAGASFPAGVDGLFDSPCDVRFTGNATANIQGQIIAGRDVRFSSGSDITYKPIYVPGTSPSGFSESLHYRREVTN